MHKYYFLVGVLGLVTLAVLIGGFSISGSPVSQRNINIDSQKMNTLSQIKYAIDNYYQKQKTLPKDLRLLPSNIRISDPQSGKEIEYVIILQTQYRLCTDFETDSYENSNLRINGRYSRGVDNYPNTHHKGYDCLSYNIQANLQKPTPTIVKKIKEQTTVYCPGILKDGECILSNNCFDTDNLNQYSLGAVSYKNPNGDGIITVYDKCSDDKAQLIENYCRNDFQNDTFAGQFQAEKYIECPYGCDRGACLVGSSIELLRN